jgi:hypothetical protein
MARRELKVRQTVLNHLDPVSWRLRFVEPCDILVPRVPFARKLNTSPNELIVPR